jgi:hypothetical protein
VAKSLLATGQRSLPLETWKECTPFLHRLSTASEPLIAAKQAVTNENWRLPFAAFPSPSPHRYRPLLDLKARPSPLTEHTTSLPSSSTPRETHRGRNRRKETTPTASSLILTSPRLHEWRVVVGRNSRVGRERFTLVLDDLFMLLLLSRMSGTLPTPLSTAFHPLAVPRRRSLSLPLTRATSTATRRRRVESTVGCCRYSLSYVGRIERGQLEGGVGEQRMSRREG